MSSETKKRDSGIRRNGESEDVSGVFRQVGAFEVTVVNGTAWMVETPEAVGMGVTAGETEAMGVIGTSRASSRSRSMSELSQWDRRKVSEMPVSVLSASIICSSTISVSESCSDSGMDVLFR